MHGILCRRELRIRLPTDNSRSQVDESQMEAGIAGELISVTGNCSAWYK